MALDGCEQDVHCLARQLVVEVARLARSLVSAHAIEHEPVRDQRVVDVGEHRGLGLERREQRLVGREPHLALGVAHARQDLVDRAIGAVEGHAQRRRDLVEERVPGSRGCGIALAEHLLLGLAAGVRREAPRAREIVAVGREALVAEHARRMLVVDRDPLELEEAQQVLELHERHLDGGVEVALVLAVDVRRQAEAGVGGRAARRGCRATRARRAPSRARAPPVRRRARGSARGTSRALSSSAGIAARAASESANSGERSQWTPALVVVVVWLIARHRSVAPSY